MLANFDSSKIASKSPTVNNKSTENKREKLEFPASQAPNRKSPDKKATSLSELLHLNEEMKKKLLRVKNNNLQSDDDVQIVSELKIKNNQKKLSDVSNFENYSENKRKLEDEKILTKSEFRLNKIP